MEQIAVLAIKTGLLIIVMIIVVTVTLVSMYLFWVFLSVLIQQMKRRGN